MVRPVDTDDQHIVQLISNGDQRGMTAMLQAYGSRVSGYLRKKFPSFGDHEIHDVLVDAVISVGKSFDGRRGTLAAWLLFLAHRAAVDKLRADRTNLATEPLTPHVNLASSTEQPFDAVVHRERCAAVQLALESLSDLERAVIEADLESAGATAADELARQLATTEGSIYAARRRARRKLSQQLSHVLDTQEK